ncbi:MAG: hypothetical protein IJ375_01650 [Oscillospiraceae bacterium]|nr:hypothetical protein [Oscillospiraceae bacterium]
MAKYTRTYSGDAQSFDRLLQKIENGVLNASTSASLEDSWDRGEPGARCAVRVFERYSYAGGNRVSMSVTLFQTGDTIHLCAITSGGSQAVFFKINTLGEEAFLDTLRDVLDR